MKPRRPYSRHGYHALKRRVLVAGTDAIDRRTLGGRELIAWGENQIATCAISRERHQAEANVRPSQASVEAHRLLDSHPA